MKLADVEYFESYFSSQEIQTIGGCVKLIQEMLECGNVDHTVYGQIGAGIEGSMINRAEQQTAVGL